MRAANAIGDDAIQKKMRGRVVRGFLHARHLRATHALVQQRPPKRPHRGRGYFFHGLWFPVTPVSKCWKNILSRNVRPKAATTDSGATKTL